MADGASSPTHPIIRSGRRLPSGRAVLGGLLITLAVFGVVLSGRLREDATFQLVTVANQDIAPGTVLGPDNVQQVRIRLDDGITSVIEDPSDVYGSVLVGPAGRLELIQRSNVAELVTAASADGTSQGLAVVSLSVERERAPARLRAGELVTVLATFDDTPDTTALVADRVIVLSYDSDGSGFGGEGVLRLGLADGAVAAAIVHASRTGDISIIGMTGAAEVEFPEATGE